jgi:ABC-type multidrug transport system fused ATPase/permease subunit
MHGARVNVTGWSAGVSLGVKIQQRPAAVRTMKEARWLLHHLGPYSAKAFSALILSIGAGLVSTLDPLLMRHLIDHSLPSRQVWDTAVCVSLIASCFIGRSIFAGAGGLFGFRAAQGIGQDLRQELLEHMSRLSADWHDRTLLGEKLSRLDTDVEQIAQFGADAVNTIVRVTIFFALNLVIMFALNVPMTLAVLPLLPVFYFVRRRFRPLIQRQANDTQAETGRAIGRIAEHLGAVPQLHLMGAEESRVADSNGSWREVVRSQWVQRRTEVGFSVSITSVLGLAILLVLGMGSYRFIAGTLTIGTVVAFYAYVTRIFEPVSSAMELYARSERMMASARRVLEVMRTEPTVPDSGHIATTLRTLQHGLSVERVSFKYGSACFALNDIDLQLAPGDAVAIVGPSGSGKSSLARLCVRLADPTSGSVIVEQRPAKDYTLRTLREIICYVPQNPILFSGSIRENLLYANPAAGEQDLEKVIEIAQLGPVLQRPSLGLDHVLDAGAAGLSGGEQQRLAVARALLRNSAVLILDESTSALDVPTEAALLQAVRDFRPEMTTLIISHRLKSLSWVDRFIVLEAGRIVGEGNHSTLLRENRLYRTLLDAEPNGPARTFPERANRQHESHEVEITRRDGGRIGIDLAG